MPFKKIESLSKATAPKPQKKFILFNIVSGIFNGSSGTLHGFIPLLSKSRQDNIFTTLRPPHVYKSELIHSFNGTFYYRAKKSVSNVYWAVINKNT